MPILGAAAQQECMPYATLVVGPVPIANPLPPSPYRFVQWADLKLSLQGSRPEAHVKDVMAKVSRYLGTCTDPCGAQMLVYIWKTLQRSPSCTIDPSDSHTRGSEPKSGSGLLCPLRCSDISHSVSR